MQVDGGDGTLPPAYSPEGAPWLTLAVAGVVATVTIAVGFIAFRQRRMRNAYRKSIEAHANWPDEWPDQSWPVAHVACAPEYTGV